MLSEYTYSRTFIISTLILLGLIWTRDLWLIFRIFGPIISISYRIVRFSIKWFFYLIVPTLIPQYYFVWPWVIRRQFPQARASRFSLVGAFRGLEWKREGSTQLSVRAENGAWRWGGMKSDGVGYLVYRVEDITVKVRKGVKRVPEVKKKSNTFASLPSIVRGPISWLYPCFRTKIYPYIRLAYKSDGWLVKNLIYTIQVLIHYVPGFARLVSIELKNCRIVLEDFDNVELIVDEISLGTMINFNGVVDAEFAAQTCSPGPSPQPGYTEIMRQNPLCFSPAERGRSAFSPPTSPPWSPNLSPATSPPMSPVFGSLTIPDSVASPSSTPSRHERSNSRFAVARRRASVISSSTSATAAHAWNRVTGRLCGSIVGTAHAVNIRLVQQKLNLKSQSKPQASSTSASVRSFKTLLRNSTTNNVPSISTATYETLFGISGRTKASLGLGFGPKKGLWGEDTLDGQLEAGVITSNIEAIQELLETVKSKTKQASAPVEGAKVYRNSQWSSRGWSRTVLRAIQSVNVHLHKLTFIHHLTSPAKSDERNKSFPNLYEHLPSAKDKYAVSIDFTELDLKLIAADSSNNERARNAFGTNPAPESKIRGIGFEFTWESVNLDCVAPYEKSEEKSQLFVIQNGTLDGFSSWRPAGWRREELLFSSDPNLALIVVRSDIGSINTAIDLQLLHELSAAWKLTHPKEKAKKAVDKVQEKSQPALPPRLRMVLDIGHMSAHLADRLSENTTAVTFDSDGMHFGCFTTFSDLTGRRRDKTVMRNAFEDEEKIRTNRQNKQDLNLALPSAELPANVKRLSSRPMATLQDDYTLSLKGDAQINVEPLRVQIKLSDDKFTDLATVGRVHGTTAGDVFGRQIHTDTRGLLESASFDWSSLSSSVDLGIDEGIYIDLWKTDVLEALIAMGQAHQEGLPPKSPASSINSTSPLSKLPSGVSARFSLGTINLFLGHEDINPDLKGSTGSPVRGTWVRTSAVFEYALYKHYAQAIPWRHRLTAPLRAKLQLPEDITVQALAFSNKYRSEGGTAALTSLVVEDFILQPIYNGEKFDSRGGTRQKLVLKSIPWRKPVADECHRGTLRQWARLKAVRDREIREWNQDQKDNLPLPPLEDYIPKLDYNVPPIEVSDTDQAQKPWLRVKNSRVHLTIQQVTASSDTEFKITSRLDNVSLLSNYSHLYSNLHSVLTVKKLLSAWKRPKVTTSDTKQPINLSIGAVIPNLTAHIAFPLKEQLYFYSSGISFTKPPTRGISVSADQALAFVPSPTHIGDWEELGRIKKLSVIISDPGSPLIINPTIEAIRIRVPNRFLMNSLILDINVTIKALKLVLQNFFKSSEFITRHRSAPEQPKHVPTIRLQVGYLSLEAKDDAADTNLNLIWRAGFLEQAKRNVLEDAFAKKIALMSSSNSSSEDSLPANDSRPEPKLTKNATVDVENARERLDMYLASNWIKRMRAAKHEQRRREAATLKPIHGCGPNIKLPINIVPSSQTAPLFRATFNNVNFTVYDPGFDRDQIIHYMGQVSSPFDKSTQFALMVPLKINWTMSEAKISLRDYPLPLLRIQPTSFKEELPAFQMTTNFIIAEEFANDDSTAYVPVEILPEGCGGSQYPGLSFNIAKTIMPVKMYGEPRFKINSKKTTEFTWGMSYQFACQDFVKVIETLSHPPRDPSPKVGAFDKMRLICHLKPIVEFEGPVHLHLKGTFDPYQVTGLGAGFALAWKGNTKFLINQPNEDHEALQIVADNLLVAIPDLTAMNDSAATGSPTRSDDTPGTPGYHNHDHDESETSLINRRYTKPCAKFVNGTKVGFGFGRERTCKPWDCRGGCGDTENHLDRKCRSFDFIPHQKVILRSPEAIKKLEKQLGRPFDSYEGFRSDYTHFSVSVIAPTKNIADIRPEAEDPARVNSLHCTPKAMHHFLRWWKLFNHVTWLPTREGPTKGGQPGSLFIGNRRKSKGESKPLATLKYRFDLKPLYISHVYPQVTKELWAQGKSESLGIKVRAGRVLFDAHQRLQEKKEQHPGLGTERVTTHRPLYAADVVADDLTIKGIRAHFVERVKLDPQKTENLCRASELPAEVKKYFDLTDYIDADRKPLDEDPQVEIVDFGDCPHVYFCRRVNQIDLNENSNRHNNKAKESAESSKFGFEKTHHCYLDEAETKTQVDKRITQTRINELEFRLQNYPSPNNDELKNDSAVTQNAIRLLRKQLFDLERNNPDRYDESGRRISPERPFQDTIEVHSPRIFYNDDSRPLLWQYVYSVSDRRKEEYHVSHVSLRTYREQFTRRRKRTIANFTNDDAPKNNNVARELVDKLAQSLLVDDQSSLDNVFRFTDINNDRAASITASTGLPPECTLKPKLQISIFKPQIALRSNATDEAIVLLAVDEASIKRYVVEDPETDDSVTSDVLTRSYALLKEVQAFYPTSEALNRERSGSTRALDFVPLEIFLDAKSVATDYDRILQRTNISGSYDQFNRIRIPRSLHWPNTVNENNEKIEHLRIHQDLMTITTPQIELSATSKHYDALYTIITDLLVYSDPDHAHRTQAIKDFSRQFDTADRDTNRLLFDIHQIQQGMRNLMELQRGYETNLERLEEAGKDELFRIRADLAEGYEHLYTINALIANTLAKDDARAFLKNALRLDVKLRAVSWKMLKEDSCTPLAQVGMKSALCSYSNNKNGSTDCAVVLGDVGIVNLAPDAKYDGLIVSQDYAHSKKKTKPPFAKVYWSSHLPIGGIALFPEVDFELANVKFCIEERSGHQIADYIFSDRIKRRREQAKTLQQAQATLAAENAKSKNPSTTMPTFKRENSKMPNFKRENTARSFINNGNGKNSNASASVSTDDLSVSSSLTSKNPLSRTKSQVSIDTTPISTYDQNDPTSFNHNGDAEEMEERASRYKQFGKFSFHKMNLTLSYTRDDTRKHGAFSLPDIQNLSYKAPDFVYTEKLWVAEEIFEQVKKDLISAVFSQLGDLIPQILFNTSLLKGRKAIRNLTDRTTKVVGSNLPSPLKHITAASTHVNTPSSLSTSTGEKDDNINSSLSTSKSKLDENNNNNNTLSTSPKSTMLLSPSTSPIVYKRDTLDSNFTTSSSPPPTSHSINGHGNGNSSHSSIKSTPILRSDVDEDSDVEDDKGKPKEKEKGLKGFLHKLGKSHHHKHGNNDNNHHSSDELSRSKSRGGSIERMIQQSTSSLGILRNRSKEHL
ncbi:uncharacterized protein L201_003751 [Kwoniella dendrophila CBS 6074]|uniref:Uncharacterized protein n=1 Tax=Kwoniella dendrophila CBS 6074 TaxID=1295534 RepID=A0AAX4JUG5_9TREE